MATNQLALYNIALAALGERTIDSTAENRVESRELDKVWDRADGATKYLLEQGLWNFATTRSALVGTTSTGAFGFTYSFALASDFVRIVDLSTDTDMKDPLLRYEIEAGKLLAGSSLVYLRFVSNSTNFGGDLSKWPETFALWGGDWRSEEIHPFIDKPRVTYDELVARTDMLLTSARQKNAAEWPKAFPERDIVTITHRELDYPLELVPRRRQQQV